jgi:hypothetical protein
MKTTTTLLLLAATLALTGCTQDYVITTNGGGQIATRGKPHLKNGAYSYNDWGSGQKKTIPAGRVTEIAPASMAEDESTTKFQSKSK